MFFRSVGDASGKVVQFKFGEDGLDVSKTKNGVLDVKRIVQHVVGEVR